MILEATHLQSQRTWELFVISGASDWYGASSLLSLSNESVLLEIIPFLMEIVWNLYMSFPLFTHTRIHILVLTSSSLAIDASFPSVWHYTLSTKRGAGMGHRNEIGTFLSSCDRDNPRLWHRWCTDSYVRRRYVSNVLTATTMDKEVRNSPCSQPFSSITASRSDQIFLGIYAIQVFRYHNGHSWYVICIPARKMDNC